MARIFLSPAERRLLASLPHSERDFVDELMQTFDATLLEEEDSQQALFADDPGHAAAA